VALKWFRKDKQVEPVSNGVAGGEGITWVELPIRLLIDLPRILLPSEDVLHNMALRVSSGSKPMEGSLVSLAGDTIRMRVGSHVRTLDLTDCEQVEFHRECAVLLLFKMIPSLLAVLELIDGQVVVNDPHPGLSLHLVQIQDELKALTHVVTDLKTDSDPKRLLSMIDEIHDRCDTMVETFDEDVRESERKIRCETRRDIQRVVDELRAGEISEIEQKCKSLTNDIEAVHLDLERKGNRDALGAVEETAEGLQEITSDHENRIRALEAHILAGQAPTPTPSPAPIRKARTLAEWLGGIPGARTDFEPRDHEDTIHVDFEQESPLAIVGYRVGKQTLDRQSPKYWTQASRHEFLLAFLKSDFPTCIPDAQAHSWGTPKSVKRATKMINHLLHLIEYNGRRKANMQTSIKHWHEDMEFLRNLLPS
jgi:hypothetical protein